MCEELLPMNLCELKGVHVYGFHIIYMSPLSSVDRSFLLLLSMVDTSKRTYRYVLRSQGLVEGKEELKADARHLKLKQENRNSLAIPNAESLKQKSMAPFFVQMRGLECRYATVKIYVYIVLKIYIYRYKAQWLVVGHLFSKHRSMDSPTSTHYYA